MRILSIVTQHGPRRMPSEDEMVRTGALLAELQQEGALVDAGGALPGLLEMQITRKGDRIEILDGPFSEAKEVVGGYLLFDAPDREAVIAVTKRFLDAAGDATCHLHEIFEPKETS